MKVDLEFLTVLEAADLLRISKDVAYAAVHSGEIPSVRIGKQFRIPRKALSALGLEPSRMAASEQRAL